MIKFLIPTITVVVLTLRIAEAFTPIHLQSFRNPFTVHHVTESDSVNIDDGNTEEDGEDTYIYSSSVSKLRSLKFVELTKETSPGLLSDYLMELGASSVSLTDHDLDTESEQPIFAEPENDEMFAAVICGDAAVGKNIWMRCDVTAHFGDSFDLTAIVDDVRTNFEMAAGVFRKSVS